MKHPLDRTRLLLAMRTLLATLAHAAPEKDLLQAGIEALMDLLQVRHGAIGMLDEHGGLKQFVHSGLSEEEAARLMQPPTGAGLLDLVWRKRSERQPGDGAAAAAEHFPCQASLLSVPIASEARAYGRIYLCDKLDRSAFSVADEELALNFANAFSLILDSARRLAELKQEQISLAYSALHDPLTNLPNRTLLRDRVGHALKQAHRNKTQTAILFCDLDDFKAVNDTLGHQAGDKVLQMVSERLSGCVREEDTVARIGGDEFVFVLSHVESADHTRVVAQKILDAVSQGMSVEGCEIRLSGSIGISVYPFDGEAVERLMKNADTAMYKAKESGKNNFRFFGEAALLMPEAAIKPGRTRASRAWLQSS